MVLMEFTNSFWISRPSFCVCVLSRVFSKSVLFCVVGIIATLQTSSSAAAAASNNANEIVTENLLLGTPRQQWDVNAAGDLSLQGFARTSSYMPTQLAQFAVNADNDKAWTAAVYRLGYYQGHGARLVASVAPTSEQVAASVEQPECKLLEKDTLLYDCANWETTLTWRIPHDATSGVYFVRLERTSAKPANSWRADDVGLDASVTPQFAKHGAPPGADPQPSKLPHAYGALGHGRLRDALEEPRASHVWFVVRESNQNAQSPADILVQTADTTWQAYNRFGGSGLYGGVGVGHGPKAYGGGGLDPKAPGRRSFKVSYNRPLVTRDYRSVNMPLGAELPGIMWLERNGYRVSYVASADVDAGGAELLRRHKVFISLGHDEYSSSNQFTALEEARRAGTSLFFWSANEYFWRIRWEHDETDASHRVMVCYKETQADAKLDPLENEWTGTFRDARPQNPLGPRPENTLSGTIFTVNAWRNDAMTVPASMAKLRFWHNSGLAERAENANGVARIREGVLGHEWDEDVCNGHRPSCMVHMSRTEADGVMYVQDHGAVYDSGSAVHRMVLFKHPESGALTWGTGTVQWTWALEVLHDGGDTGGVPPERANPFATRVRPDPAGTDRAAQQLSFNVFAMAGVHAATPQADLVPWEASDDHAAPRSRVLNATPTHVDVMAFDEGGGAVAAVEVSVDGGRTWCFAERHGDTGVLWRMRRKDHASLTKWNVEGAVLTRAVDDSLNCEPVEEVRDELRRLKSS
ncbi:Mo-co_dimer domain-containing protein [Pycnococcus provasolii]